MATAKMKNNNETIEGDFVRVVSIFETNLTAWDIEGLSQATIDAMMEADDIEEFAEENEVEQIEIVQLQYKGYGSDMCDVDSQSEKKALIDDIEIREVYDGGVREYMNDFDEIVDGVAYWDGRNFTFILENEEEGVEIYE